MGKVITLDLKTLNKYIEEKCGGKEYYLGCWSEDEIKFNTRNIPDNLNIKHDKNWLALSNGKNKSLSLIHDEEKSNKELNPTSDIVIFRGYLLEEALHSYSNSQEIREYWRTENYFKKHNGIFSTAVLERNGEGLTIITDIFGISPIYYRKIGKIIFFASTPALLAFEDDKPDTMAWLLRLLLGYIPEEKTLTDSIKLAPPASVLSFTKEGKKITRWYDYGQLPNEHLVMDDEALSKFEVKFSKAISRCQRINHGKIILPLSSGYDSRRILAHLLDKNAELEACTVQMPDKNGYDIDASCASKIADDFKFKHEVLKYPNIENWYKNDTQRIYSLDAQHEAHTWSVRFFNYYYDTNACFYDGLGGDVLICHEWLFRGRMYNMIPESIPRALKSSAFPDINDLSNQINTWQTEKEFGANKGTLYFMLWKIRKGTGTWAQQQSKPGHLVLCPYLDIDLVEAVLKYSVIGEVMNRPQQAILNKFWPKLAAYKGTRNMPDNPVDISQLVDVNFNYAYKKRLKESYNKNSNEFNYTRILKPQAQLMLFLSQHIQYITQKCFWWSRVIVEIVYWWKNRPFIIKID